MGNDYVVLEGIKPGDRVIVSGTQFLRDGVPVDGAAGRRQADRMFVEFFIRRPIFATVCALLIILAGAVSIPTLPIAQFPALAPPQVTVFSNYIGASAQVVETAVTIPLEQQINGAEGLKYLTSSSGNDGTSQIVATFELTPRPRPGRGGHPEPREHRAWAACPPRSSRPASP